MRKGFRRGCGPERIPGRAALTCPTCFRIHLEAHAHAKPWAWHAVDRPYLLGGGLLSSWMPNAERIPRGMRPGKDSGPSGKDSAACTARKGFRAERKGFRGGCGPERIPGRADSFGGACPRRAVGMAPGGLALPASKAHARAKSWEWHSVLFAAARRTAITTPDNDFVGSLQAKSTYRAGLSRTLEHPTKTGSAV